MSTPRGSPAVPVPGTPEWMAPLSRWTSLVKPDLKLFLNITVDPSADLSSPYHSVGFQVSIEPITLALVSRIPASLHERITETVIYWQMGAVNVTIMDFQYCIVSTAKDIYSHISVSLTTCSTYISYYQLELLAYYLYTLNLCLWVWKNSKIPLSNNCRIIGE